MQKFGTIPGVYVSEIENPDARIATPSFRTVGVIGRSTPSLTKYDITVLRGLDTDVDAIPGIPADNVQNVLCVSDYAVATDSNLPQYTEGLDYEIVNTEEEQGIKWLNLPEQAPVYEHHPTEDEVLTSEASAKWGAKIGTEEVGVPTDNNFVYWVENQQAWPTGDYITFGYIDAHKDNDTITDVHALYPGQRVAYVEETVVDPDTQESTTTVTIRLPQEGDENIKFAVNDVDTSSSEGCWIFGNPETMSGSKFTIHEAYDQLIHPGHRASKKPEDGAQYYVSLKFEKSKDNIVPLSFEDYESVKATYGPELYYVTENGTEKQVINEVVVGAKLAFVNGADVVTCLEILEPETDAEKYVTAVKEAIDLMCDTDVISFVCLPATTTALQQYLLNRVVIASSLEVQKEKTAYVCPVPVDPFTDYDMYIKRLKQLTVDQIITQAQSFHEERIAMPAGAYCTIVCEDAAGVVFNKEVSSIFAACAMIGWHGNNNNTVALPLTRKNLTGIYDVKEYKRSDIEKLSRGGVTVMVNKNGSVMINQAVTTNTSSYNTAEISVVLIKDEIKRSLREPLDDQFIGTVVKKTTGTSIKTAVISILDSLVDKIILSYDSLKVTQNQVDTTQFDVSFRVSVCRPLNYINISFMVNL